MFRFFAALIVSLVIAAPTEAQMACAARSELITRLGGQYSEAPVAMGLANNGGVLEVFSSPEGSTWTILVTDTNGISCLVAAGEYWGPAGEKKADKGI